MVFMVGFSFGQDQQQSERGSQLPPEQAAGGAELIMGYTVAPVSVDKTERELGLDSMNYPTNTSLGYKGVVMDNLHNDDTSDEIAVDFGSLGLWIYDSGTWHQISGVNPDGIISAKMGVADDNEIVVDFGSLGLWIWNYSGYPGIWYQRSGVNPTGMFATDDDNDGNDEIQVDFGSLGVWRWDWDTDAWIQLSGLNPYYGLRMDVGAFGYEEGVWCFPGVGIGVWNIYMIGSSPVYNQLTGTTNSNDDHASARFTNAAGAEDLIMDFGALGLWLYKETWGPWVQVSGMSVNRVKEVKFVGTQDYELLAEDNAGGLYWANWNGTGMTFTLITSTDIGPGAAWCETFDQDGADSGDEEVIIPWTAGGASVFDYSAGSTLTLLINTDYFVKFMVKGDYYNLGYDSTMLFVFDSPSPVVGVWLYAQGGWGQWISNNVPDGGY